MSIEQVVLGVIVAGPGSVDGTTPAAAASAAGASGASAGSGELAEDMLQMALRMASEMSEEPVMDLEDSVNPAPVRRGAYPRVMRKSRRPFNCSCMAGLS